MGDVTTGLQGLFGAGSPTALPTHPAAAPVNPSIPVAERVELSDAQKALLKNPWDPFNHAQHEAKMNEWYMGRIELANAGKVAQYVRAWRDWLQNFEHSLDLGLDPPPPPARPVMQKVAPMPDGYWFGKV